MTEIPWSEILSGLLGAVAFLAGQWTQKRKPATREQVKQWTHLALEMAQYARDARVLLRGGWIQYVDDSIADFAQAAGFKLTPRQRLDARQQAARALSSDVVPTPADNWERLDRGLEAAARRSRAAQVEKGNDDGKKL